MKKAPTPAEEEATKTRDLETLVTGLTLEEDKPAIYIRHNTVLQHVKYVPDNCELQFDIHFCKGDCKVLRKYRLERNLGIMCLEMERKSIPKVIGKEMNHIYNFPHENVEKATVETELQLLKELRGAYHRVAGCGLKSRKNGATIVFGSKARLAEIVAAPSTREPMSDSALHLIIIPVKQLADFQRNDRIQFLSKRLVEELRKTEDLPQVGVRTGYNLGAAARIILKLRGNDLESFHYRDGSLYMLVALQFLEGMLVVDILGGKRHLGETSRECANRETSEESDGRVSVGDFSSVLCKTVGCMDYYFIRV